MKKKFKIGVSNWNATFKNKDTIQIQTVTREIVDTYSGGGITIVLRIAEINDDLKLKLIEGVQVKRLEKEERFYVTDKTNTAELEKLATLSIYPNMQIHRVRSVGKENEWGAMEIIFTGGDAIKDGKVQLGNEAEE